MAEYILASIGIFGTILATWLTLRSQENKNTLDHDVAMAELQENIRKSLLADLHTELDRERDKRRQLEDRVQSLEQNEQRFMLERDAERKAFEKRIKALEAENADLKRRLVAFEK